MREGDNIRSVESLGIDLMGFIFYDKSPRNVIAVPSYLPEDCKRVGVFVDSDISSIVSKIHEFDLDYIQLHGKESATYINDLRKSIPQNVEVIKCIHLSEASDIEKSYAYETCSDYLLFENKSNGYGGSGSKFDWGYLSEYKGQLPFLLSGGIGPGDISSIHEISHPKLAGIDLNSLFEIRPGYKDISLLQSFINKIRNEQNKQAL